MFELKKEKEWKKGKENSKALNVSFCLVYQCWVYMPEIMYKSRKQHNIKNSIIIWYNRKSQLYPQKPICWCLSRKSLKKMKKQIRDFSQNYLELCRKIDFYWGAFISCTFRFKDLFLDSFIFLVLLCQHECEIYCYNPLNPWQPFFVGIFFLI